MNIQKLKEQEVRFLLSYPGGFENRKMQEISKKHNIPRLVRMLEEELTEETFKDPSQALEIITKIITRSSLVSIFEKAAFKNMLVELDTVEIIELCMAFKELLYGGQALGFQRLVEVLGRHKNAKWPIVTALLYYFNPSCEVLIKPTTVKAVIKYFELEDLKYSSKPDYEFYSLYRERINELKTLVEPALQVENAGFCGFLMFAVGLFE